MRERFRRLKVIVPLLLFAWFAPTPEVVQATDLLVNGSFTSGAAGWSGATSPSCSGGLPSIGGWTQNALVFSYITNTVTQEVVVPQASSIVFRYSAVNRPEEWGRGRLLVSLSTNGETVSSGWFNPTKIETEYVLTTETVEPNQSVTVSISGDDDGLFWGGCYGSMVTSASLNAISTGLPSNAMWAEIDEGWSQIVSAPEGSVFTDVLFASYGNPSGQNGIYEYQWCHAEQSKSIIENLVLDKNSAVLNADNGVFGDPCGGTYKRLYVTLLYSQPPPPSTTTTTSTTISQTTTTEAPKPVTTVPEPETTTTTVLENETSGTTTTSTTTTQAKVPEPETVTQAAPQTTTTSIVAPTTTLVASTTTSQPATTIVASTTIPKITEDMTTEQVVEIITNTAVLAELSEEELEQVFENLDVSELSESEVVQLVESLSSAPDSVKSAFESKVNIYSDEKFGSYVPQGSVISVNQRRVIIVVSTVMASIGIGMPTNRRQ